MSWVLDGSETPQFPLSSSRSPATHRAVFRRREIWALIAVQVLFASNAVVGRLALRTFTPQAILVFRICGAAAIFWAWAGRSAWRERFSRRDVGLLVACAILGLVLNQGLYLFGLSLSTATNATVVGTSIPVFTVAIAMLVGDERFSAIKLGGIGLALLGALSIAGFGSLSTLSVGDLLLVANCLSFAGYLVLTRRMAQRHDPMVLSRWTFAIAAFLVFPIAILSPIAHGPVTVAAMIEAVFLVLGPTVLAYFFNAFALRRVDSSIVASFVYLQPAIAAAVAVPLLGERPGARTGLGGLLIFLGVLLAATPRLLARRRPAVAV
jgi:drug/metabolite transporter (DMT)-like permease